MTHCNHTPNCWHSITAEFERLFAKTITRRCPAGVTGQHLMTPNWLGNVLVGGEPVEISTGKGMDHQPIFGVTFSHGADGLPNGRDCCCQSLQEAYDYLYGGNA